MENTKTITEKEWMKELGLEYKEPFKPKSILDYSNHELDDWSQYLYDLEQ